MFRAILLLAALLCSSLAASAQTSIDWSLKQPFRFFTNTADFDMQREALADVLLVNGGVVPGTVVSDLERLLNDPRWLREWYKTDASLYTNTRTGGRPERGWAHHINRRKAFCWNANEQWHSACPVDRFGSGSRTDYVMPQGHTVVVKLVDPPQGQCTWKTDRAALIRNTSLLAERSMDCTAEIEARIPFEPSRPETEQGVSVAVTLPDGRLLDVLSRLRKDNTGYDLKDLFIGAEGTLGIITAAVVKLYPAPRARATAFIGLADPHRALALLRRLRAGAGDALTSFEILPRFGLDLVLRHLHGTRDPLAAPHAWYVLAELSSPRANDDLPALILALLADAAEAGEVEDAALAASQAQAAAFWALREALSDAQKAEGASIKHDISVPVARMADFMLEAGAACMARLAGLRVCAFGHMGDGNIHFNLSQPVGMDPAAFLDLWEAFNRLVHDLVATYGGSISAEHGIGLVKREELRRYKDPVALELMQRLKACIDPSGLMNPGKILVPGNR